MSEVHIKINGKPVVAQDGQTILEAAKAAGVDIPVPVSYTHLTLPTKRIV